MGENDFTNDTTENIVSEPVTEVDAEPVTEVNGYDEAVAEEDYKPLDTADDEGVHNDVTEEVSEQPENDVASENLKEGESSSAEQKNHKSNLDGYRAYRKKNLRDTGDSSAEEKSPRRKLPEVKLQGNFLYMAGLVVVTLLDFFIVHLFTSNQAYNVSDMILSALGFDALHFTTITYDQICLGLGYFVAFLLGGLILFVLLSILNKLFVNFIDHKFSGIYPVIALGIFAVVFVIGFIISYFSNDAVLIPSVYRWGAPALAYLGGLIFYGASKLHVGIEY